MPPRKGNGCSPQFPRDSVAAALAPPPLLKLTPHPLQGGHTLLPFHSIHRLPSKLLAQTMLSQGSSSFHACLPERHNQWDPPAAGGLVRYPLNTLFSGGAGFPQSGSILIFGRGERHTLQNRSRPGGHITGSSL